MARKIRRLAAVALIASSALGSGAAVQRPGSVFACLPHIIRSVITAAAYNSLQYKPHIVSSFVQNGVLYYLVEDMSCRL